MYFEFLSFECEVLSGGLQVVYRVHSFCIWLLICKVLSEFQYEATTYLTTICKNLEFIMNIGYTKIVPTKFLNEI